MAKRQWTAEEIGKQVQQKPPHWKFVDMEGKEIGRIKVGRYCGQSRYRESLWECRCSCGKHYIVGYITLNNPKIVSCGCYLNEVRGKSSTTHGMRQRPEYTIWAGIKRRCYGQGCRAYKNYGGRGIIMMQEWRESFEAFFDYVGPQPTPNHEIDRINNDGNYEPGNVRWATCKEQANNRRSSRLITVNGETKTLSQWSDESQIPASTISARIKGGWSSRDAVFKPRTHIIIRIKVADIEGTGHGNQPAAQSIP